MGAVVKLSFKRSTVRIASGDHEKRGGAFLVIEVSGAAMVLNPRMKRR